MRWGENAVWERHAGSVKSSSTAILQEKFPQSRTKGVSTCKGIESVGCFKMGTRTANSKPFSLVVASQGEPADASYLTWVTPPSLPGWAASRSARSRGNSGRTAPSRWPPPGRGCQRWRPAPPRRRPVTSGPRRPR